MRGRGLGCISRLALLYAPAGSCTDDRPPETRVTDCRLPAEDLINQRPLTPTQRIQLDSGRQRSAYEPQHEEESEHLKITYLRQTKLIRSCKGQKKQQHDELWTAAIAADRMGVGDNLEERHQVTG